MGPSRTGLWTVRLVLGFVYAALVAGVELWVAFSLVGVEHEASTTQVYLFLAFATAAALTVTLLLAAAIGPAGIGVSAVLNVILGLVSAGDSTMRARGFPDPFTLCLPATVQILARGNIETGRLPVKCSLSIPVWAGRFPFLRGLQVIY